MYKVSTGKQRLSSGGSWAAGRLFVPLPSCGFSFCASHVSSISLWTWLVPRSWVGWRSSVFLLAGLSCSVCLFWKSFLSVLQLPELSRSCRLLPPVLSVTPVDAVDTEEKRSVGMQDLKEKEAISRGERQRKRQTDRK